MSILKKELHEMVDLLPKKELQTARKLLKTLITAENNYFFYDDESLNEKEKKAIKEAHKDIKQDKTKSIEDVLKQYGLEN